MESYNDIYSSHGSNAKYFKNSIIIYISYDGKMTTDPLNIDQAHIWFPPYDAYTYIPDLSLKPTKSILKKK